MWLRFSEEDAKTLQRGFDFEDRLRDIDDPSCGELVRSGLIWMLASEGGGIERIDGQPETPEASAGPWVVVEFDGGRKFSIWKATGAVYRIGDDAAVVDPPLYVPRTVANSGDALRQLVSAYPPAEQLRLLADATEHLLDAHSCDAHGYEGWRSALLAYRARPTEPTTGD